MRACAPDSTKVWVGLRRLSSVASASISINNHTVQPVGRGVGGDSKISSHQSKSSQQFFSAKKKKKKRKKLPGYIDSIDARRPALEK
jgi:hypothetical protein